MPELQHDDLRPSVVGWGQLSPTDWDEWDALATQLRVAPDGQSAWTRSLIEAHGMPLEELFLLSVREARRLRLVLPVRTQYVRVLGTRLRELVPIGSIYSLHHELLTDLPPDAAACAVLRALDDAFEGWGTLRLSRMAEGSGTACAWAEQASKRALPMVWKAESRPPYLVIDCSWDDYLRRCTKKFRSNLGRETRNLEKAGRVRIEHRQAPGDVRDALEAVTRVEASSWKAISGTSMTARDWEERFYSILAGRFAKQGQIVLSVLLLDDRPIAHDLMLLGPQTAYGLKSSFDNAYRKLSPGSVLEAAVIRWVFEAGYREYDFLGTDEPYKLQWTDAVRQHASLDIYNARHVPGQLLYARRRLGDRWRALRSEPAANHRSRS